MNSPSPLRQLPSVETLLQTPASARLIERYGREALLETLRQSLADARSALMNETGAAPTIQTLLDAAAARLSVQFTPTLRPVINATGVIIHTNLGRAPLSVEAQQAIQDAAAHYSALEYDLETGKRGSRLIHAEAILCDVTGAQAALVVNNNAAALVLLLSALANGRGVIISRGQLVEIGGGFRIPEVMEQSGAVLVEVGATNRTRPADYARALQNAPLPIAMILRAHASNFKQIGFTESAALAELARIAHDHHILLGDDLGSGALLDTASFGLEHEPTVGESLAAGADVVAFSGDKLLGAPQAGIIVGRKAVVEQLKQHPLARAVRADKLCLAGLAATLDHYRKGEAVSKIPVWRMIARPFSDIEAQAQTWANALGAVARVIQGESTVGGGSLPGATLPTALLALAVNDADAFAARLRAADPPLIARIHEGRVLFDPRTVLDEQGEILLSVIQRVMSTAEH